MYKFFHHESAVKDGNLAVQHGDPETVVAATQTFLESCGLALKDCVLIACQHTDDVTHVTAKDTSRTIPTEALITNQPGVVLFLLTGDCFPVSFYDSVKQVVALAHLGWKPTDRNLATKVMQQMVDVYGSQPKDIEVYIGSGIQKGSYVFSEAIQAGKPGWDGFITNQPSGEVSVDLSGYITQQLLSSGVLPENIKYSPIDTATSPDRFSYYRSKRSDEPQARFATVVGLSQA
jgi:hypothetical protein